MDLQIRFVCPECNEPQSYGFHEIAPGRRQICQGCQTPVRLTTDSLDLFAQDLRQYCEA